MSEKLHCTSGHVLAYFRCAWKRVKKCPSLGNPVVAPPTKATMLPWAIITQAATPPKTGAYLPEDLDF